VREVYPGGRNAVRTRHRDPRPAGHDGWMTEGASAFAMAGFLGLVFVGFTLLAMDPLVALDAYFNLEPPPDGWVPVLHVLDRVGQRAVCLPVLAVVTWSCCRKQESWRPAFIALGSVLLLNFVVGLLKIGLGRGQPAPADPSFFIGGMAYPSGHTANIVLVYGLSVYLLGVYYRVQRPTLAVCWSAVAALSLLMVVVSLTLNWHWFADLIAGLIVGAAVLELTVGIDAVLPDRVFDSGFRGGIGELVGILRTGLARATRAAKLRRTGHGDAV
jgi:membrane-associated phospholipid phosphatase